LVNLMLIATAITEEYRFSILCDPHSHTFRGSSDPLFLSK
jgi:hypothetical protein